MPLKDGNAVIFNGKGLPLEKIKYDLPDTISEEEILVEISLATVCGSDVHTWLGHRPFPTPCILGHEMVGKIIEMGSKIKEDYVGNLLKINDKIVWSMTVGCNNCFFCKTGLPQKCYDMFKYGHVRSDLDQHFTGGFAKYVVLKKDTSTFKIPENLSNEEVAPLMCAGATVTSGLSTAEFGACEFVIIQGCGALGLYACAFTKELGAGTIIAIDTVESRLKLAKEFGADYLINPKKSETSGINEVNKITKGRGADFVIEMTGDPNVMKQGLEMLRIGGKYVLLGAIYPNSNVTIDISEIMIKCIQIIGMHNYHPKDLRKSLDLVNKCKEKYPFKKLVGPVFPFSPKGIENAFASLDSKSSIRPAILPNS